LRDQDWVTVWVLQEFREVNNVFVKNWLLGEELLQVVLDQGGGSFALALL